MLALAVALVLLEAEQSPTGSEVVTWLVIVREFGGLAVMGATFFLWVTGRILSKKDHERVVEEYRSSLLHLRADRDEERRERVELQRLVDEKLVPSIERLAGFLDRWEGP